MSSLKPYLTTKQNGLDCCGKEPRDHCVVDYRRKKEIDYICYSEWLPNVRILVPHIPDNILLDYIRRAAIEFAVQSKILTRNIELLLQDCVADYWPCLGPQERIMDVRLLSVGGECYEPVGHTCSWRVGNYNYWFHPPNSLEIHPAPKECSKVILTVTAAPSETSTHVDKFLYDNYFQAIAEHAAASASMVPPMDDSDNVQPRDGNLYQMRMRDFQVAVTRAKVQQARNFSTQRQFWR